MARLNGTAQLAAKAVSATQCSRDVAQEELREGQSAAYLGSGAAQIKGAF